MGVHGDKAVVGGKTSTLNSLSPPINNKKKTVNSEISGNTKLHIKKSSSVVSPTAAGSGKRSNATASVDINMAPALTEPLSPTEKLSNAAATTATTVASPIPASISTESDDRKFELTPAAASSSPSSSSLRASPASREKRCNTRSATHVSTRVTRSKDTGAATTVVVQERANTPNAARESPPLIVQSLRKSKRYSKEHENEQMGLSVATPPPSATAVTPPTVIIAATIEGTDTADVSANPTSSNNNNIICKDNSTAQLLADLTTDFEETITAEICLRKQLPEVKVTTPDAAQLSASSETESETTASKSAGGGETPDVGISIAKRKEMIADAGDTVCHKSDDKIKTDELQTPHGETNNNANKDPTIADASGATNILTNQINACSAISAAAANLDMPPVSSDSTMTASEEEPEELDALEKKLSQLDGLAVENTISGSDSANATQTPAVYAAATTTTTVLTGINSPQQMQVQHFPASLQQTTTSLISTATPPMQQLMLTPTGSANSIGVGSHMMALPPLSSSSLVREVNVAAVGGTGGSGGGEIEDQELEEVLKSLKGFDADSAGSEGMLCDLNVLFGEGGLTFNCEEMAAAATNTNAGTLQQQQPQPQVSLLASTSTSSSVTTKLTPTSPLKELHADIEKKQQIMQRKIDFILRRLRKLQVRYMSKHTAEEIAGLFELIARLTLKGTNSICIDAVGEHSASKDFLSATIISARPPPHSWEEDLKTGISSTQMLNLLERLEKSATTQQICTTANSTSLNSSLLYAMPTVTAAQQIRKSKKLSEIINGASSSSTSTTKNIAALNDTTPHNDDCVVAVLNPQVVDELTHVTGMLRAEMRDIQVAYDSDATESSSGGESADEMVAYNNQVQQTLSIVKRSAWRYSRERAAIASRWSWLLSQIADLEIKIRQHSELYQEVVRTKGAVVCEEELTSTVALTTAASSPSSTSSSAIGRTQSLINPYGEREDTTQVLTGASRTRGFMPTHFRKRKMLQTTSLHTVSKKAARPSTIKCGCQCPYNPCALCTGRTDPTAPRDLPDTMMFPERVALLDPGFHPVLSFSENVSNSIHFETIARTPQWQNRTIRIQPKSVVRSVWKAEREAANLSGHHSSRKYSGGAGVGELPMPTQKRRYIRRKERNTANTQNAGNHESSMKQQQNKSVCGNDGGAVKEGKSGIGSSDFAMAGDGSTLAAILTPPSTKQAAVSKFETSIPAATLAASTPSAAVRNGTANLFTSTTSTTATTPLVANTVISNNVTSSKKTHNLLIGDGVLLEPLSPSSSNNSSQANCYQTPQQQNYDQYNPSPTLSSLISNTQQQHHRYKRRHYKQRRSVVSSLAKKITPNNTNYSSNINSHNNIYTNQQQHSFNHNSTQNNILNGDINFDNLDTVGVGGRSRTASPTHGCSGGISGGSSSNYHKYERSLERRNRISYDIDNIVIPYSVAAATRVELLPYKEIPTPKWRVFDGELAFDQEQQENKIEMLSSPTDECLILEKYEQNEAKEKKENTTAMNFVASSSNDDQMFAKPNAAVLKPEKETSLSSSQAKQQQQSSISTSSSKAKICDKPNENFTQRHVSIVEYTQPYPPPAKKIKTDDKDKSSNSFSYIEPPSSETVTSSYENEQDIILACDLDEDITDDVFNLRHERALHEERRKFQTYLKFPWSTRSRANRRIDSRAESSGANTPDPASPAPNTPSIGGGDQESIPSPLAPTTPLTPLDAINETPESGSLTTTAANIAHSSVQPAFPLNVAAISSNYGNSGSSKRNERRRTTSTRTQYSVERNERRSLTPDSREVPSYVIPPFEPLKFPLSDEAYETLASVTFMPPNKNSFYSDTDFTKPQSEDHNQQQQSNNGLILHIGGGVGIVNTGFGNLKTITPRNGRRATFALKLGNIVPDIQNDGLNGGRRKRRPYRRNQSILDGEHKVADNNENDFLNRSVTESAKTSTTFLNGQVNSVFNTTAIPTTAHSTDLDDDDDDDFDFYDALAEADVYDDDDGYPKHSLAPNSNIDNLIDDDYDPDDGVDRINDGNSSDGVGGGNGRKHSHPSGQRNSHLGLSDSEFSEPDPFEDDDPNDPEWKGETTAKAERQSERLRKRSYY